MMGDIADMMLDGTLCEGCGGYIDEDGLGIPRYCSDQCAKDRGADWVTQDRYEPRVPKFRKESIKQSAPRADQVACPECGKVVKKVGLNHHQLDKHGAVA